MTAPAPLTDTDAALTRIQAVARTAGFRLTVVEQWDVCFCADGTHPWVDRHHHLEDEVTARAWTSGPAHHVVHNYRLDGYTSWEVAE